MGKGLGGLWPFGQAKWTLHGGYSGGKIISTLRPGLRISGPRVRMDSQCAHSS
jgi:hypothetical protein